jgi:hypothetical protein
LFASRIALISFRCKFTQNTKGSELEGPAFTEQSEVFRVLSPARLIFIFNYCSQVGLINISFVAAKQLPAF